MIATVTDEQISEAFKEFSDFIEFNLSRMEARIGRRVGDVDHRVMRQIGDLNHELDALKERLSALERRL